MARLRDALPENVPGDFFVDESCIDCDTCRQIAPETFAASARDQSYVHHQPASDAERLRALMALVACPTSSIGTVSKADTRTAAREFPEPIAEDVYYCGYASELSFGASSYFIRRPGGNVLVDSPRAAGPLLERIEALGGVRYMFLTHRDDVADHAKWAAKFGCERIIMASDARGMEAETKLKGDAPYEIAPGLTVYPTPGHTRGSACLHYNDKFLFTGDHMAWSKRLGHLYAFRSACWYDWDEVVKSLHRLEPLEFQWVLPGHGWPWHGTEAEKARQMRQCLDWADAA